MSRYSLRAATNDDFEFLALLHRLTMKEYVDEIWGWDDEEQARMFKERFVPDKLKIIKFEGESVGMLSVEDRGDELFLSNILLMPESQNFGLGSDIMNDLKERATKRKVPLTLTVLKPNRAKSFYERLGFVTTGEEEVRFHMRWAPEA